MVWPYTEKLFVRDSLRQVDLGLCSITAVPSLITDAYFAPVSFLFTFFSCFLEKILLRMQVFGRWARGPSSWQRGFYLDYRTSQVELVSQGQAPIKGFHLSLLVAHPMLAFRSILTPGPERWTPPPCPGFVNPIEVKFPFQAVLFAIRVSPGEGGGPIHLFQKVRRFISKNRNVRAVSLHVPNYLVPDCFLIQSVSLEVVDSYISKWTSRLPILGDTIGLNYQNLGSPWAFGLPCPSQQKRVSWYTNSHPANWLGV